MVPLVHLELSPMGSHRVAASNSLGTRRLRLVVAKEEKGGDDAVPHNLKTQDATRGPGRYVHYLQQ